MLKKCFIIIGLFILFSSLTAQAEFSSSTAETENPIPMPCRVGGTLTLCMQLRGGDNNIKSSLYHFEVTRPDGTSFEPKATSKGLNPLDYYNIDIPIYEETSQPNAAKPVEEVVIHVYENGHELTVISPSEGLFTVEESGDTVELHLEVKRDIELPSSTDVNNDGKAGLEDAIYIFQMVTGIR